MCEKKISYNFPCSTCDMHLKILETSDIGGNIELCELYSLDNRFLVLSSEQKYLYIFSEIESRNNFKNVLRMKVLNQEYTLNEPGAQTFVLAT